IPVFDNGEDFRCYGLLGARLIWMWERFGWRTVDPDVTGVAGPLDQARYFNVVSNRMYGVNIGCGNEWKICETPIGAFAIELQVGASLLLDVVKERAGYEIGDFHIASKRSRNDYTLVPELEAEI